MNAHQLELFYHVARSGGVTRAVRRMPYGIQQPTISAQVNALERDLGVTLYQRRPFKLTSAGEELFRFVEPFFGRMAEVRATLQGASQLRIGASPIVFSDYLPPVLRAVQRKFPQLNLILRAVNQPELIGAVEQGELDVVISLIPDNLSPVLRVVEILQLEIVLLVPKTGKLKSVNELWTNTRIAEPLISLKPDEIICQVFQETLANRGRSWLPKIEVNSLELIERYVEKGFGAGLSIHTPGKRWSSSISVLKLPEFPLVRLGVICRSDLEREPAAGRVFLEEVSRQAARFSPEKH